MFRRHYNLGMTICTDLRATAHTTLLATLVATLAGSPLGCAGDDAATAGETETADATTDASTGATTDAGPTTGATTGGADVQPAELVGRWISEGCEAYPNGMGGENYLKRDFTLTETTWKLDLIIYGDPGCATPFFQAVIDGPYSLGGASAAVPGATEGDFAFTTIVWTARQQAAADLFNMSGCGAGGWMVDVPQDVGATGCIGVAHPIADCPKEHDIIALDGDALSFGQRITDMCTPAGRPTALNSYPVVRQ